MLLENLYHLDEFSFEDGKLMASVTINPKHEVFKGHFPGNPVMPGVCMIQMIKELTEKAMQSKLFMQKSSNIKFMALINPEINPKLELDISIKIEEDLIKVKNITKMNDVVALKLNAVFNKS